MLPGFLEPHEQPGGHPLLISDASQPRLGSVKDMRAGTVYLEDPNGYVDLYRAEGSGLRAVCVSHFPESPSPIGQLVGQESDVEVLPPHEMLVANPATSIKTNPKMEKVKDYKLELCIKFYLEWMKLKDIHMIQSNTFLNFQICPYLIRIHRHNQ